MGLDVDGSKIERLLAGTKYVEDVTDEQLHEALATGEVPGDDVHR